MESEWFTRGWTLQELLAPEKVVFLNANWKVVATKVEIAKELSTITGIPTRYLNVPGRTQHASVAMRMSWVARRCTTRAEDMAYCLLGLFDVNMPLLYGENKKAFIRLQLEIIKKSDDDSIFAWTSSAFHPTVFHRGMLALWPTAFSDSGNVVSLDNGRRPPVAVLYDES